MREREREKKDIERFQKIKNEQSKSKNAKENMKTFQKKEKKTKKFLT